MKPIIKTVLIKKKLKKCEIQSLPSKEWIARYAEYQIIEHRNKVIKWSLGVFTLSLICTFGIFLLEGFKVGGFSLPEPLLNGLGCAVPGQVAGLLFASFRYLYKI
jgi:hypothetical protein